MASSGGSDEGDRTGSGSGSAGGGSAFECNICLDQARDAVVTMCGHLFCWPCVHQWMETRRAPSLCPVCKAAISRDTLVPLYGRNSSGADPRDKVPPRPAAQRTEPTNNHTGGLGRFMLGDTNFHISFGVGAFPLGFFSWAFNLGAGAANQHAPFQPNQQFYEDDQWLSKAFICIGVVCLLYVLFV